MRAPRCGRLATDKGEIQMSFSTVFKTRKGHDAYLCGAVNRFNQAPYKHMEPNDMITVVWHKSSGQAVGTAHDAYDSTDYVRQEHNERLALAKRRARDNWL